MIDFIFKVDHQLRKLAFNIFQKRRFKAFDASSTLIQYLKLAGTRFIIIEKNVYINKFVWLGAYQTGSEEPVLRIGEGSAIGNFNHIAATGSVIIGKRVLTADKVYISDHSHGFNDIHTPINDQPIVQRRHVLIDDGAWLGENVSVLGANVGKNSVVGSNSVVTKDIPDYCVAVGVPAVVIKTYNFETQSWQAV